MRCDVGPIIDQLNLRVRRSDTVNAPEALDYADRIPVDVVIDEVIAILEVLSFRDTVGANQDIDLIGIVRHSY